MIPNHNHDHHHNTSNHHHPAHPSSRIVGENLNRTIVPKCAKMWATIVNNCDRARKFTKHKLGHKERGLGRGRYIHDEDDWNTTTHEIETENISVYSWP